MIWVSAIGVSKKIGILVMCIECLNRYILHLPYFLCKYYQRSPISKLLNLLQHVYLFGHAKEKKKGKLPEL